jgi:SAM-dependent methyltransferase
MRVSKSMSRALERLPKSIKQNVKILRGNILESIRRIRLLRYRAMNDSQVFNKIYREGLWGSSPDGGDFFSGQGSHRVDIVDPYVESVRAFLNLHPGGLDVLDLGCGDFKVGAKLAQFAKTYVACDIVESLILNNQKRYDISNVQFVVIDGITDDLPRADVIIIRQVFQHLSNQSIKRILVKLESRYRFLIVTEDLPLSHNFLINPEKHTGPHIRRDFGGGIDLSLHPFNLSSKRREVLCEVVTKECRIVTTLFEFRDGKQGNLSG